MPVLSSKGDAARRSAANAGSIMFKIQFHPSLHDLQLVDTLTPNVTKLSFQFRYSAFIVIFVTVLLVPSVL